MSEPIQEVMRMSCSECRDGRPIRMVDRPHHTGAPCTYCNGRGYITRGDPNWKRPTSIQFFAEFLTDADVWHLRAFVNSDRPLPFEVGGLAFRVGSGLMSAHDVTRTTEMLVRLGLLEEHRDPRNRTDKPDAIITQMGRYVFANIVKLDPKFVIEPRSGQTKEK